MLAKKEHEIAYQDINDLLRKHQDTLTPLELLAVAANLVGKLIAYQDMRYVSPEKAVKVVSMNIEMGNKQALADIHKADPSKPQ